MRTRPQNVHTEPPRKSELFEYAPAPNMLTARNAVMRKVDTDKEGDKYTGCGII